VRSAEALLDAGASANAGFYSQEHRPEPTFESVLYGAAGIAHHAELTRLLLERGANPNDAEVPYHAPEGYDSEALKVLVTSRKLHTESLATILLRKVDWHDYEGIKWLLEWGVDPNLITHWRKTAIQQAVLRDNDLKIIEVLLDHGADPKLNGDGPRVDRLSARKSIVSLAARRGRGDILGLFETRGIPVALDGIERLLAACATNDLSAIESIVKEAPQLFTQVRAESGKLLAEFSGNGNTEGVRRLLDLGVDVQALYEEGDGYYAIAKRSTALHVAAWRARHSTVKLLIQRGAAINELDGEGRSPLGLAVRACVDSYWKARRSPDSVRFLLEAGASTNGVPYPSGYSDVDHLLKVHGARAS
jgi:ankyrin repeat protein